MLHGIVMPEHFHIEIQFIFFLSQIAFLLFLPHQS